MYSSGVFPVAWAGGAENVDVVIRQYSPFCGC